MANISDGGKGVPPDPHNANITTDTISISTPSVYSDKNDQVWSKIDRDIQFFVHTEDASPSSPNNTPVNGRKKTPDSQLPPNETIIADTAIRPAIDRAKKIQLRAKLMEF